MKAFFVLILTAISIAFRAQTNIPGGNLSGTLTLGGSPYLVQGHVIVPPNTILKINPGVVIEFQGHYKLNVQGRLLAQGNVTDSITFRVPVNQISTGWWGVRFEMTGVAQDSSLLEYCKIRYGKANGNGDDFCGGGVFIKNFSKVRVSHCYIAENDAFFGAGVFIHWASPLINNNAILNNKTLIGIGGVGGAGICCDSAASPLISRNLIANNVIPFSGHGGGIDCNNASPSIQSNTITNNTGDLNGAGIACINGAAPIINNNIVNLNSGGSGAGIYCDSGASPIITGNAIHNNTATASGAFQAYGGGLLLTGASSFPVVIKNMIRDNSALTRGGGLEVLLSTASVRENTLHNNFSGEGGGISVMGGANIFLSKNVITNNQSTIGGGISLISAINQCLIINNLIANNTSFSNGGGIASVGNSPNISNCAIVNNKSNTHPSYTTSVNGGGGVYFAAACNATLTNCILYNNVTGSTNGHQVYLDDNASDPPFYNCAVEGGQGAFYTNGSVYSGTYTNNIVVNPFFVSPSAGAGNSFNGLNANWNVTANSPCINSGKHDTTGLFLPPLDLGGMARVTGYADMGVYESGSCAGFQINTSISQNPPALTVGASGTYQWLNCASNFVALPGQNGASFTPTINGNYAVAITAFGCTDTTACFQLSTVGMHKNVQENIPTVYPNPSRGDVQVTNLSGGLTSLEVMDELGRVLYSIETKATQVDLHLTNTGLYFLRIKSAEESQVKKLVIY